MRAIIDADISIIRRLLMRVIGMCDWRSIERLGGMTNHTYKVELLDGNTYVVRIPGRGTEQLIDRADERISVQLACDLGIDAQMLSFNEQGEKVSVFITGAKTLNEASFKDAKILCKAAAVLRKLHNSGVETNVPFDFLQIAAGYERIMIGNDVRPFDRYEETKAHIIKIKNYVAKHTTVKPVPCHNDPLCENWVMSSDGRLYLIDWEYAGMNDNMWDLADISIEAGFTLEQDDFLLRCYLERESEQGERLRFFANKIYLDFLWSLWGKARAPFVGTAMEEYGEKRYLRLQQNMLDFSNRFRIDA